MLLVRGLVSGSKMAFNWAPTVVGEFACQVPHAVAALLQLHIPAVLLQLVINGFGPVRISSIDHV